MDLSIIIASWNSQKMTGETILSIIENTSGLSYEIIIIDNCSKDGSLALFEKYQKKYKNIVVIKNAANMGFGYANNQGFEKARGEFVLMLNSDTLLYDNILFEMVFWMREHKKVGAATCALLNKDRTLQGSGGFFPTLSRVFCWMLFVDDLPYIDLFI
jgi:GT2 family glycosyltransferase